MTGKKAVAMSKKRTMIVFGPSGVEAEQPLTSNLHDTLLLVFIFPMSLLSRSQVDISYLCYENTC